MENTARYVVIVATKSVNFPGLGVTHSPQLNTSVIGTRDNKGQGRVESSPIDTSIVTFEDKVNCGVVRAKNIIGQFNSIWLMGGDHILAS